MKMLSLYDYLGRAAGSTLGLQVATIATEEQVNIHTRTVDTVGYKGAINLYPQTFLEQILSLEGNIKTYYLDKHKEKLSKCQKPS